MAAMTRYMNRIILPYRPKAIVLFLGTNDRAGKKPSTAQQVYQGYLELVKQIKGVLPRILICKMAITPTPSRWKHRPAASEANRLVKEHSEKGNGLHFIDLTTKFIGSDGMPNRRLFRADQKANP
jgi:lysophospholipase L1-like esterase